MTIDLKSVQEAEQRIQNIVKKTPLERSYFLEEKLKLKAPLYLKIESFQHTGSFKVRGATNKILSLIEQNKKPKKVVAASAGNHAQGVAYICHHLKIPAAIFMPQSAPLTKIEASQKLGAEVYTVGSTYHEAFVEAQNYMKKNPGSEYVHAFSDDAVASGQGTVGLEIHNQLNVYGMKSDQIQVVVPLGGGGLISGIAASLSELRTQAKFMGVVSETAPVMARSFHEGKLLDVPVHPRTIAEGLAIKQPSQMTFDVIKKLVQTVVEVDDTEVAVAIYTLIEQNKLVIKGAGAAGLAALLSHKIKLDPNIATVIVLSGGNIDLNLVSNILERALTKTGRWLNLRFVVDDKPGELAKVAKILSDCGANLLEVFHDRISPHCPIGQTFLQFRVETKGMDHSQEIRLELEKRGLKVEVVL